MPLYPDDLNDAQPVNTDKLFTFATHIKRIKQVMLDTFPFVTHRVVVNETELNYMDNATSNVQTQLNTIESNVAVLAAATNIAIVQVVYSGPSNITVRVPNGWAYENLSNSTGPDWLIRPPPALYANRTTQWYRVKLSASPVGGSYDAMPRLLDLQKSYFRFTMMYTYADQIAGPSGKIGNGQPYNAYVLITYDDP
jgi:hypothetical protein